MSNKQLGSSAMLLFFFYCILCSCGCKPAPPKLQEVPEEVSQHFQYLGSLPGQLNETSGLAIEDSTLWSHNDSGDGPFLYQLSLDGTKLLRRVQVKGAAYIDWEEITQDNDFFYLGDFGNNNGNRKDLCIYEVTLASLREPTVDEVTAKHLIRFSYSDQNRFDHAPYQHNFDCEAMIALGDSLYLFSKNHADDRCRSYALPKHQDVPVIAQLKDSFDVKGTITAAAYEMREEGPVLVLLGYNFKANNTFYPFIWLFTGFEGTHFFSGQHQRIDLPPISQTEGIVFLNSTTLLISSEAEHLGYGKLFQFNIDYLLH